MSAVCFSLSLGHPCFFFLQLQMGAVYSYCHLALVGFFFLQLWMGVVCLLIVIWASLVFFFYNSGWVLLQLQKTHNF